jgi:hypothetical protein
MAKDTVFVLAAWLEGASFRVFPFARLEAIRTAVQAEKLCTCRVGSINQLNIETPKQNVVILKIDL